MHSFRSVPGVARLFFDVICTTVFYFIFSGGNTDRQKDGDSRDSQFF